MSSHNPIARSLISSVAITLGIVSMIVFGSALAHPVSAKFGLEQTLKGIGSEKPATYTSDKDAIPTLVGRVIATALSLVGTVFLILMIYGGFLWMTARGDTKQVEKARGLLSAAIVGVIIVASAYAVTTFVLTSFTSDAGTSAQPSGDAGPVTSPSEVP